MSASGLQKHSYKCANTWNQVYTEACMTYTYIKQETVWTKTLGYDVNVTVQTELEIQGQFWSSCSTKEYELSGEKNNQITL